MIIKFIYKVQQTKHITVQTYKQTLTSDHTGTRIYRYCTQVTLSRSSQMNMLHCTLIQLMKARIHNSSTAATPTIHNKYMKCYNNYKDMTYSRSSDGALCSTARSRTGRALYMIWRRHASKWRRRWHNSEESMNVIKASWHNTCRWMSQIKGVSKLMQSSSKTCCIVGPVELTTHNTNTADLLSSTKCGHYIMSRRKQCLWWHYVINQLNQVQHDNGRILSQ